MLWVKFADDRDDGCFSGPFGLLHEAADAGFPAQSLSAARRAGWICGLGTC